MLSGIMVVAASSSLSKIDNGKNADWGITSLLKGWVSHALKPLMIFSFHNPVSQVLGMLIY